MRRTFALIVPLVAGLLLLAASLPSGTALAQSGEPAAIFQSFMPMVAGPDRAPSTADQAFAVEILNLVNRERSNVGCPPVRLNAQLAAAAQGHSDDMARNDYFAHTSLDGTTASQRVTQAGYSWTMTAENIAAGYHSATKVMEGWMMSSGHRANILGCSYSEMGVGYTYQADDIYPGPYGYSHYWTQVFAKP